MSESFAVWACDPHRTLEERFGAEILIEQTLGLWSKKHGVEQPATNYEAERFRKKDRQLNPAYEPRFTRADAEHVGEVLSEVTEIRTGERDDRALGDLSFIRFCRGLVSLTITHCEAADWSPLLTQPTLTTLNIWGTTARDLRFLGQLSRLQSLRVYPNAPWPDLAGLENLRDLRELYFRGNILALRDVPCLPQVRHLELGHHFSFQLPLRSVADLPELPELRHLHLDNTTELHGIERYATLLNAVLYGYYTDLTPLTALQQLTHLTLSGGEYASFAPLAKLANLCRLVVRREEPPDFTALADAPRLHEIELELSPLKPVELTSLRALLPPWSDELAVPAPRPLAPLKLILGDKFPDTDADSGAEPRPRTEDTGMRESEYVWFCGETNRRLTKLLGKGWGAEKSLHRWAHNQMHVSIGRGEDLDRVPEIIQCLREILSSARYPFSYFLVVDYERWYERSMEQIYDAEDEEFDADRERENWEDEKARERERREFLERRYRHRLRQESGLPTKPEEFAPPKPETESGDTVFAGSAPEPPGYNLNTNISLYCWISEKACYFNEHFVDGAKYYLGYKPEA
ncbi:MAG: hypothetical protein EPO07_04925 [Verrucomicrobia bacterium]|nr:MAG: hypothetical protein EPO07_04925 [Verrucomicrobiota bacterium]